MPVQAGGGGAARCAWAGVRSRRDVGACVEGLEERYVAAAVHRSQRNPSSLLLPWALGTWVGTPAVLHECAHLAGGVARVPIVHLPPVALNVRRPGVNGLRHKGKGVEVWVAHGARR